MVIIDSITISWVNSIGGETTIYTLLSLMLPFTIVYIIYKIST